MSLKLNSSGGGSVTLQEPVTASDLTVNLPATLGNTGNSMQVTSDASGNVGIGATPNAGFITGNRVEIKSADLGTTAGNISSPLILSASDGNVTTLQTFNYRVSNGSGHTTAEYRTQRIVDVTRQAYVGWGSDYLAFGTNNTERMRIDSSGNLGLGVTPSAWNLGRAVEAGAIGNALWGVNATQCNVTQNTYYNSGFKYASTNPATYYSQISGSHIWYTAPSGTAGNAISFTQAMTLDASGNLLVGHTGSVNVGDANTRTGASMEGGGNGTIYASRESSAAGLFNRNSDGTLVFFNRSGTTVGSVSVTSSATAYNTSSDYRLKNTIAPMTGALAKVALLKPCTYKWNADGSDGEGFIAHELAEVVPDAVTGTKDAVDPDGKPVYQGIDTSFLVATLTAAIQELKAELDTVKAELAVLKGTA